MTRPPSLRPSPRLSVLCLGLAALSFVTGWILVVLAAPEMEDFFYQPRVLAITHTFTLGWISLTIIGVLYQYVPALTKRAVWWRRGPAVQVSLFALGASGMIVHFWIDHLDGMAWSAGLVLLSAVLLAALLLPSLLRAPRYDATVVGIVAGLAGLVGTATLGTMYAIDKVHPYLSGSVLSNIAGHAHLGLLGWITVTICAVSYRMVAAFVLPTELFPRSTRAQMVALVLLAPLLVTALLLRAHDLATVTALLVVAAIAWYAVLLWRLLRTRRLPLDWSLAHVLAALLHLAGAALCALLLLVLVDPESDLGNRVVLTYGVLALIGWISNFIVGMASRVAPGLLGKGSRPLLSSGQRGLLFGLLNAGIGAVVAAILSGSALALRIAATLPLAAALLFGAALLHRLGGKDHVGG